MKRLFQFILLFFTMTTVVPAQEKKSFTLEDVIPGGSNYYNLVPKSLPEIQWWGDNCVRTDAEQIIGIDTKTGKRVRWLPSTK